MPVLPCFRPCCVFLRLLRYSAVRGSGAFRAIFGGSGAVWVAGARLRLQVLGVIMVAGELWLYTYG